MRPATIVERRNPKPNSLGVQVGIMFHHSIPNILAIFFYKFFFNIKKKAKGALYAYIIVHIPFKNTEEEVVIVFRFRNLVVASMYWMRV